MSEWAEKPLGQLAKFQKGRKVATSNYQQDEYDVYLGASSLGGGIEGYASTKFAVLAEPSDVLMLWDGERSGLVGHSLSGVVSSTVQRLTPSKEITGTYLYHHLSFRFDWIQGRRTGTGVPHVPKDLARILTVKYPVNPVEQERITDVLASIDSAIEKTEALIAKYQQIKAGLMHDMFTRGVTADGKLRPPRAQAPELYRETPIGWIPKEWDVKRLVDLITFPSGQVDPRQSEFVEWILIAPDHIEKETGRLLEMQTASEQGAISGKYTFQPGDIVYSKIRPYLRKAILADFTGLCSADMYPLRPVSGVNPRYLLGVVLGDHFSRFAESVSMRSGFPKINRDEMSGYRCAVPLSFEQEIIAKILLIQDMLLTTTQEEAAKLRQEKHGLMHDLLTGRMRVKPAETEVVSA